MEILSVKLFFIRNPRELSSSSSYLPVFHFSISTISTIRYILIQHRILHMVLWTTAKFLAKSSMTSWRWEELSIAHVYGRKQEAKLLHYGDVSSQLLQSMKLYVWSFDADDTDRLHRRRNGVDEPTDGCHHCWQRRASLWCRPGPLTYFIRNALLSVYFTLSPLSVRKKENQPISSTWMGKFCLWVIFDLRNLIVGECYLMKTAW